MASIAQNRQKYKGKNLTAMRTIKAKDKIFKKGESYSSNVVPPEIYQYFEIDGNGKGQPLQAALRGTRIRVPRKPQAERQLEDARKPENRGRGAKKKIEVGVAA